MKISVEIGQKKILDSEKKTWRTSRFTWGEGHQETDHVLTTTRYVTRILVFVDDLHAYKEMNGITESAEFNEIPALTHYGLRQLTGLKIFSNLYNSFMYSDRKSYFIPKLEGEMFAYIGKNENSNNNEVSFNYHKIELSELTDNMTLVREIKAYTTETEERSY